MLTDDLLEQLLYKGEGSDLDYKAERYAFAGATDEDKSEMLKDILALANAHRDGTAYILIGFRENAPHPAEVVGVPADGAIDDSRIQQFVNEKLETKLNFRYEERMFKGKRVAVISIPKQPRPFYLKKPYGKLPKETVYIRRGSATGTASLREVVMMGAAYAKRPAANVNLALLGIGNSPLPTEFSLVFFQCSISELPDFSSARAYGSQWERQFQVSAYTDNSEFWRDAARRLILLSRLIQVRIKLTNNSEFALTGAKLEIHVAGPSAGAADLDLMGDLPSMPPTGWNAYLPRQPYIRALHARIDVDHRGDVPICNARLGTILPGEEAIAEDDLAILPAVPGEYVVRVRLLAEEINTPITIEHGFEVEGEIEMLDFERLREMVVQERRRDIDE